ncbi:TetR/AcrR family transcriptional regulator [Paraburkholderia sp. BL9I2N2]|uniref:TetR/AcrR family transcriptional regulator n=1 Tax=Paraburkholderia sp. BL9I2N2 TaxID=1938809 RepID=UPI00104AAC4B|nr:TetR/AcrR family transcriptional regulator [Paraburkholderia sp. BL9I2N2]TCK84033.1 TetR family transcriptional regulator [Paraburkholderia sp. BL9I2N2]
MQKSPIRRTVKRPAAAAAAPSAPGTEEREPRGARRKRETRARLLEAALNLMAQKGMEGVAINEITEAADVGFGSFYNHFESKEAIHAALTDQVFEDFADTLERLAGDLSDPAEVISVSVRHTLLRARREPVWGQFLIREGLSPHALNRGLGQRLSRDIRKGIAAKRFSIADPLMALLSVGGTVLAAIAVDLYGDAPIGPEISALGELGLRSKDFPERAATALLQTLGIGRAEANRIARRPLPVVESQLNAD